MSNSKQTQQDIFISTCVYVTITKEIFKLKWSGGETEREDWK